MNRQKRFLVAMVFSALAALCFVAGQPRFAFLSPEVGKFAGIGLSLVAGAFWASFGIACSRDE